MFKNALEERDSPGSSFLKLINSYASALSVRHILDGHPSVSESIVHAHGRTVTVFNTWRGKLHARKLFSIHPPDRPVRSMHPHLLSSSNSNWSNNRDHRRLGWDLDNDSLI
jgi:hypothetical protein